MPYAFYLPTEKWSTQCHLEGQEAHHLSHALRLKTGERVYILDGHGKRGDCEIQSISRWDVRLQLLNETFIPRPASLPVIALAWSKAARQNFFMEKIVELGAYAVWLWPGEHSQGRITANLRERWQAQCIAAMKQCQNPWLPEISILEGGVKEVVDRSLDFEYKLLPWEVLDNIPMLTPNLVGNPGKTIYVIGPEGGFSGSEIEYFYQAAFKPVSLGARVLRCETAALVSLGIHWWSFNCKSLAE